ncbi:MAG TPA: GtrA family protein [Solirubrobacteraceae bacterium]|jgi:putative flippase GtrA|nr:GtrA family protein [Solirubrobacteraceae bacterium]
MPVVEKPQDPPLLAPAPAEPRARGLDRYLQDTEFRRQVISFAVIGVGCTIAFAILYSILRHSMAPFAANGLALLATMGINFALNRAHTFRGHEGTLRSQAGGYLVAYLIGYGASTALLYALLAAMNHPHGMLDTLCALVSGLLATAVRFVLMRAWVFKQPAQAA